MGSGLADFAESLIKVAGPAIWAAQTGMQTGLHSLKKGQKRKAAAATAVKKEANFYKKSTKTF